jgi:hypothetical protein
MGMFDYIRCKMPLPQEPAPPQIEWFQTKDVSDFPYMEKWTIEADGRLIHHEPEYSFEPNENETGLMALAGSLRTKSITDRVIPFHGDLQFYHYHFDDKNGEWWEYTASFTDGLCTRIWCSDHQQQKEPLT